METQVVTADVITALAGLLLSAVFSYIPGLNVKFAQLEATYKRLIMLGLLIVSSLVIFGVGCWGVLEQFGYSISCDQAGAVYLLRIFLLALVSNQSAFLISPEAPAIKQYKSLRGG